MSLILEDPNLIVKCGDDYFNWTVVPNEVLLAMAFRECRTIVEAEGSEVERHRSFTYASDDPCEEEVARPRYKKTVRLTSDDIASLELKDGPNFLTFSVTTSLQVCVTSS